MHIKVSIWNVSKSHMSAVMVLHIQFARKALKLFLFIDRLLADLPQCNLAHFRLNSSKTTNMMPEVNHSTTTSEIALILCTL